MKIVRIITDGSCVGNPGPGGWAAILRYGNYRREVFGSSRHTTNNRMELAAAIEGLRALRETCQAEITTDSQYLKNGITRWIRIWKRNGWKTADKRPVLNQDLWQALEELAQRHHARWVWTKGHAADPDNCRADELAREAALRQTHSKGLKSGVESRKYDLDR
jgi:ribonuclease HI